MAIIIHISKGPLTIGPQPVQIALPAKFRAALPVCHPHAQRTARHAAQKHCSTGQKLSLTHDPAALADKGGSRDDDDDDDDDDDGEKDIDEDIEALRKLGILVDGERPGEYLLQIFMKEASVMYDDAEAGPFFFELIQRKGNRGFGEGNFRALFESIERSQEPVQQEAV